MKALDETIKIGHGIPDDRGTKLEPEEQPVDRVIDSTAAVTLGNAPGEGEQITQPLRVTVTDEMTADDAVDVFTRQCQFCMHWDQSTYRRERRLYDQEELDEQRAGVLEVASPRELARFGETALKNADAVLDATLGRCQALSQFSPDGVLDTHARAFCPASDPDGNAIPIAFKPRPDAQRTVISIRDRILKTASGKE